MFTEPSSAAPCTAPIDVYGILKTSYVGESDIACKIGLGLGSVLRQKSLVATINDCDTKGVHKSND